FEILALAGCYGAVGENNVLIAKSQVVIPPAAALFWRPSGLRVKRWLFPSKQMYRRSCRRCFLMFAGNAICMLAGTPTPAGRRLPRLWRNRSLGPISRRSCARAAAHASEHAVADREGVMKL